MASVNFFQPGTDTAIDVNQIQRQRALADLLVKQGQSSPQGQMVSGHYVAPSATSYLAQLASALAGGYKNQQADDQERTLAQTLAANRSKDASAIMQAVTGTPGQAARDIQPLTPNDDEGNAMPVTHQAATPAQGPDMAKALGIALNSQDPTFRSMAPGMMTQQMQGAQLAAALGGTGAAPAGGAAGGGATGGSLLGAGPGQIDPRVVQLAQAGPVGEKLAGFLQDARKPIAMREGDLVVPDGQGGFKSGFQSSKLDPGFVPVRDGQGQVIDAKVLPGYAGGKASIAGATAAATGDAAAARDMVTVDVNGTPTQMTRAQFIQLANPQAAQTSPVAPPNPVAAQPLPAGAVGNGQGPVNGKPIPNAMAPRPGDSDQALIYKQERVNIAQRLQAATQAGDQAEIARNQADAVGLEKEIGSKKIPGLTPMPVPGMPASAVPGIPGQDDASKKFGQTVASESAQALIAGRDKAKNASDDLLSVGQARKAIQTGAYQGSGADTKLAIAKFVNANIPGVTIDAEKVGNTDYLKSTLGSGVLAQAKSLGANPSNADAERINDIVGSIGKDPQAMSKLLDWREAMARRAIDNHNRTVQDAEQRGMKSPYDLRVNAQSAAPAAGGGFKIIGVQ